MRILRAFFCPLLSLVLARWREMPKIRRITKLMRGGASGDEDQFTMVPRILLPPDWEKKKKKRAIILMDRFSEYHGGYLEQVALEVYGVAVIHVMSTYLLGYFQQEYPHLEEQKTMGIPPTKEMLKTWQKEIKAKGINRIEAVICESDSGLAEAEQLACRLGVTKHNGINEARRNKYLMIEAVRQKAPELTVMKQKMCKTIEEALEFAENGLGIQLSKSPRPITSRQDSIASSIEKETGLIGRGQYHYFDAMAKKLCIVKPKRGAASDSVFLVSSISEMEEAFAEILGSSVLGEMREKHDSVLVQEFVVGTEYAVDIVSRNGQHKVAALWKYDKRPTNNRAFVYYATELIGTDTSEAEAVCDYATSALDALGLKWGLTHTEIIIGQEDGVCRLIEVNARQHNMDFAPLTMACIGYNALDMLLAAYLGNTNPSNSMKEEEDVALDWKLLPDRPVTRAHGAMVHLVNHLEGELIGVNDEALREIQNMDSTLDLEVYHSFLQLGNRIEPTVDIKTDAGWIQMIHDDAESFVKNYYRIVSLMPTLFFVNNK